MHYGLLNIVLQIIYDGWFYCFCEKYAGCIQSKWGEKKHCPVSKLQIDFSNIEERADCPQIDFDELTKISDELFPYLEECYEADRHALDAINGHYEYSHRHDDTGYKHFTSLRDMIKMATDMSKL